MIYCSILLQNAGCCQYLKDFSELLLFERLDGSQHRHKITKSHHGIWFIIWRFTYKSFQIPCKDLVSEPSSSSLTLRFWVNENMMLQVHSIPPTPKNRTCRKKIQNSLPASLQQSHVIPCPSFLIQVATKINSKSVQLFTWSNTEASGIKSWRQLFMLRRT